MENITQFVSLISSKGGVAKKNRFKINIPLSDTVRLASLDAEGGRDLSLLCESISFPNKTINTIDYSLWRNPIKIPTGFSNEDVTAVFHLTNDYYVKKIFDSWLNYIVDTDTYYTAYSDTFRTDVDIYQLDDRDLEVYKVQLKGAYPTSITAVDLDNTATNATQKLTVNFTYKTWEPINTQLNIFQTKPFSLLDPSVPSPIALAPVGNFPTNLRPNAPGAPFL